MSSKREWRGLEMVVSLFALLLLSQDRLTFGVKGGVMLSPAYELDPVYCRSCWKYEMNLNRFSVGPFAEALLLRRIGLRVEAGAMYRRARADGNRGITLNYLSPQAGIRAKVWEVPLLLKRRINVRNIQAFASAGASLRKVGPFTWDRIDVSFFPNVPPSRTVSKTDADPLRTGVTAGGGIRLPLYRRLHLEPEFRYTHWTSKYFMPTTEQFDFVLGLSFGK